LSSFKEKKNDKSKNLKFRFFKGDIISPPADLSPGGTFRPEGDIVSYVEKMKKNFVSWHFRNIRTRIIRSLL
jgi:hypothetical protein